jgi:hypothetical protein
VRRRSRLNFKLIGVRWDAPVYVRQARRREQRTGGDVSRWGTSRFEYWQNPYAASAPMVDSANPGLPP